MKRTNLSRRGFLKSGLAGAAGAMAVPYFVPRRVGANERVIVGMIGVGGRGLQNMPAHEGNIAAVCDVEQKHLAAAIKRVEASCEGYRDFRALLDRKDLDGVVITTPDHWHAIRRSRPAVPVSMSIAKSPCRCS